MVIASVSGAAAGAGASLALTADFIICSENAKFIMAFVNLGLVPDTGGSYLLVKQLGPKRAMDICATGRPVSAQEAKDLGIVYRIVPNEDLDGETMKFAKKLASGRSFPTRISSARSMQPPLPNTSTTWKISKSRASANVPGPRISPKASARSWKNGVPILPASKAAL